VDDPHTPVAGIALLALQKALSIPTKFSLSVTPAQHEAAREQFRAWWKDHAPTGRPADHPAPRPVSGGPAPTFTLTDTDGKRWTLETAQGKTFIFHFFGTWCGPCVPDMLALERLHQQRPEVTILAAGLNEQSADDLRGYAKSQGITFPMAMCPGSVAERYGDVLKVPTTFVIDSFGRIHRRLDGPRILETYLAICDEVRTDELKTDELKTVR
jgi:peroxiredoxin